MKVQLIHSTPEAESLVKWAGHICYRSHEKSNATLDGFIRGLINKKHLSVLEHWRASFIAVGTQTESLGLISRNRFLEVQLLNWEQDTDELVWLITGNARALIEMNELPERHGFGFFDSQPEHAIYDEASKVSPVMFSKDYQVQNLDGEILNPIAETKNVKLMSVYRIPEEWRGTYDTCDQDAFTFYIHDVSRALTHQLVRHRMASYSQAGQRYCAEDNFPYVTPDSVAENSETKEIYDDTVKTIKEAYNGLVANGIKKEDARMVLPNACCTELAMTVTRPVLENFINLRADSHAQWEIRDLAEQIRELTRVQ